MVDNGIGGGDVGCEEEEDGAGESHGLGKGRVSAGRLRTKILMRKNTGC
jgi:hypothetical protein